MCEFADKAYDDGIKVIIAGAGGSAHLPGMLAAITHLPVIGVRIPNFKGSRQFVIYSSNAIWRSVGTVIIGKMEQKMLLFMLHQCYLIIMIKLKKLVKWRLSQIKSRHQFNEIRNTRWRPVRNDDVSGNKKIDIETIVFR